MLAGLAGALYVPQVGIINPGEFAPLNSIEVVIWVAVGGTPKSVVRATSTRPARAASLSARRQAPRELWRNHHRHAHPRLGDVELPGDPDPVVQFDDADAERVKAIERTTNHDVKAVEYFLKERFAELGLEAFGEFVHFGLTSQDVNNTAVPLSLKEAWKEVLEPETASLVSALEERAEEWKDVAMLARTHGQPASPG